MTRSLLPDSGRALAGALARGYATAFTDTGHTGTVGDGSFAFGHPEKLIDFAYRAVHEMTVQAKTIVQTYYGTAPKLSYWNAGSIRLFMAPGMNHCTDDAANFVCRVR